MQRVAWYLTSLRRAISQEVDLAESMQPKHTGRFCLPSVISNYRHTIQRWMRGDELLAGSLIPRPPLFPDLEERGWTPHLTNLVLSKYTSTVSSNQRRQFTVADFFNDSVPLGRGLPSQPTMPGLAHPAQSPGGGETDSTASNYELGPMEIPELGQNNTILARPQALGGSTQARCTVPEGGIPPGTTPLV
jgi:hypothetical protein